MKRFVLGVIVLTLLAGSAIYAGGKYTEVEPVLAEMLKVFEKFVTGLEKAENADAVAAALDYHAKTAITLAPKMKEIMKKYPELKDENSHPEELKPLLTKMDELIKRMVVMYGKIGQYTKYPKVKEAFNRWQEAMKTMEEEKEEDAGENEDA